MGSVADAKRQTGDGTMTTKQADNAIKSGAPVTLHNARYDETFTVVLVSRDRHTVTTSTGSRFERDELQVVSQ